MPWIYRYEHQTLWMHISISSWEKDERWPNKGLLNSERYLQCGHRAGKNMPRNQTGNWKQISLPKELKKKTTTEGVHEADNLEASKGKWDKREGTIDLLEGGGLNGALLPVWAGLAKWLASV